MNLTAEWPTDSVAELCRQVPGLPRRDDLAIALPMGASTLRALLVDRAGNVIAQCELDTPSHLYLSFPHALLATLRRFGCVPAVGAAFLPGPVSPRGDLMFPNIKAWPEFERDISQALCGFHTEWFNDGPAGLFGLPSLSSEDDFVVLQEGAYEPGDPYGYAIYGTGLNVAIGPNGREDGHGPFAALTDTEFHYFQFLQHQLGRRPDWEDACSGGVGFRHAVEFILTSWPSGSWTNDPFVCELDGTDLKERGKVVTAYALNGHDLASRAVKMVGGIFGTWLGSNTMASQLNRLDIGNGVLGDPDLLTFFMKETEFLKRFRDQGRDPYSAQARNCQLRVCKRNPEPEGARLRAAELLQRAA